ncbi:MAG: NADH-quinone oxidoreductase subunit NuoE [Clostridia bacterium]
MEHCDQCKCKEQHDYAKLQPVLEEYARVPGSLITILQHAQEIYGYLPTDVLWHISEQTKIKPAKVLGVATFYTQFRFKPVGKYLILLCNGTACHVNGAKKIEETITEELGIEDGGTTEDGLFSLKVVACLGCCSLSPVMMINDETYGSLTPDKVRVILNELRQKSEE